ncbi:MAG: hypothetical protein P8X52_06855 [Limibacillus sp.]
MSTTGGAMSFWKAYFRVPASMIVWVMETFAANRARLASFVGQPRVASFLKGLFCITLIVWLAIAFLIADEDAGHRFTEAVKEYVPQTKEWGLID